MSLTTFVGKMFGSGNSEAAVVPNSNHAKSSKQTKRMQYCITLNRQSEVPNRSVSTKAWKQLEQEMAVVPAGSTRLMENVVNASQLDDAEADPSQLVEVDSFYIDKTAVTNAQFAEFVKAGGYENMELWSQEIWSHVLQLVDQTGTAGPRFWQNGKPARDRMDHPVVGICWYEAEAYARWVGKRLPDTAQWQRAASWHTTQTDEANPPKFPWGDTFETQYANAWISAKGSTVPVEEYYKGATPNGVYQLIGNTWELLSNRFVFQNSGNSNSDLIEIRGGAFDTYMDTQMTCQFRTGQPLLFRGTNVGFRCVANVGDLHRPTE